MQLTVMLASLIDEVFEALVYNSHGEFHRILIALLTQISIGAHIGTSVNERGRYEFFSTFELRWY